MLKKFTRPKTKKANGNLENLILLIFSRFFPVQKIFGLFYVLLYPNMFFMFIKKYNICKGKKKIISTTYKKV